MSGIDYGTLRTKKQKVKWMKDNKKTKLIENFLKQNKTFPNKKN